MPTDITKLIIALRNFGNAPKNSYSNPCTPFNKAWLSVRRFSLHRGHFANFFLKIFCQFLVFSIFRALNIYIYKFDEVSLCPVSH